MFIKRKAGARVSLALVAAFILSLVLPGLPGEQAAAVDNNTQIMDNLNVGDKVVDKSWGWEFRTDDNYEFRFADDTAPRPVTWIVAAKNHYSGSVPGEHITRVSEELIGRYNFDSDNYNHWGNSDLRVWLNDFFYDEMSAEFQDMLLETDVPHKKWEQGDTYSTTDKVFIPSATELGAEADNSYEIGTNWNLFTDDDERRAELGGSFTEYWTRSPHSPTESQLRTVTWGGDTSFSLAYRVDRGVRPVINVPADVLVSQTPDGEGVYTLEGMGDPVDPVPDPDPDDPVDDDNGDDEDDIEIIYEEEPNNSYADANEIFLEHMVVGTITDTWEDIDIFKLDIEEAGTLGVLAFFEGAKEELIVGLSDGKSDDFLTWDVVDYELEDSDAVAYEKDVTPGTYYLVVMQTEEEGYHNVGLEYALYTLLVDTTDEDDPTDDPAEPPEDDPEDEPRDVYYGDVTSEGDITVADAILILRHIVGLVTLEGDDLERAKVSGEDTVTVGDAILVLRYIVGLIEEFPAGDKKKDFYYSPCGVEIIAEPAGNEFVDEDDGTLYLSRIQIVSPTEAYGTRGNADEFTLWKTADAGETFEEVNVVNARNTGTNAGLWFHAYSDEMWYTTRFSGFGRSGTAGVSYDGGHTWNEKEETIHDSLYDGSNQPINGLGRVKERNLHVLSMREDRDSLAISKDGGTTWQRHDQPSDVTRLRLHATDNYLFAAGLTTNLSSDWELFRFDFATNTFEGLRDELPEHFEGRFGVNSIITTSPSTDVITITDQRSHETPERSALFTTDNGESFQTLYFHEEGGDEDGYELRRALAVSEYAGFIVEMSSSHTRIRATNDGGDTWHTIEERRNGPTHVYELESDREGNVYALWTGASGATEMMQLTNQPDKKDEDDTEYITENIGAEGGEISFSDTARLIIQPDTVSEDSEIMIAQVDKESALSEDPLPENFEKAVEICDISYSFEHYKPLAIEIDYDPEMIPEGWDPQIILTGTVWDTEVGGWRTIPAYVDEDNNRATIKIWPQQEKLNDSGGTAIQGLADRFQRAGLVVRGHASLNQKTSERFVVVYNEDQNVHHNDWKENGRDLGPIHMVNDTLDYLEEAWDYYETILGLDPPGFGQSSWVSGGKYLVFLEQSIYESEYGGTFNYIYITPYLWGGKDALKFEAAHELFHLFQNRQTTVINMYRNLWWTEATAEAAAGLVFSHITGRCPHETGRFNELRSSRFWSPLHSTILNHEYITAHFVNYLMHHEGIDNSVLFEDIIQSTNTYEALQEHIDLPETYLNFARYAFFSEDSPSAQDNPQGMSGRKTLYPDTNEYLRNFELNADCTSDSAFIDVRHDEEGGLRIFDVGFADEAGPGIFLDIFKVEGDHHTKEGVPVPDHTLSQGDEAVTIEIGEGESFYVMVSNTGAQDEAVDILIENAEIYLDIDPPEITQGMGGINYEFTFTAKNIPEEIENVVFYWDFGDGEYGSTGDVSLGVTDGEAEHTVVHSYPIIEDGHGQEYTLTVSLEDSSEDEIIAEAQAEIILDGAELAVSIGPYDKRDVTYELKGTNQLERNFIASAMPHDTYRFDWDFDDGHTFSETVGPGEASEYNHTYTGIEEDTVFRPNVKLYCEDGQFLAEDSIRMTVIQKTEDAPVGIPDDLVIPADWTCDLNLEYSELERVDDGSLTYFVDPDTDKRHGLYVWYHDDERTNVSIIGCYNLDSYTGSGEWGDGRYGTWHSYHENGSLETRTNFENGVEHGPYTLWREDGSVMQEGQYKNGERHGTWNDYDTQGRLRLEAEYKEGERHGEFRQWGGLSDNHLVTHGQYENGVRVGLWTHYRHDDGTKYRQGEYINGKEPDWEYF